MAGHQPKDIVIDPWEDLGEEADGIEAPSLQAFLVNEDPYIAVVPNFLTEMEIEHLIDLTNQKWVPSEVDFVSGGKPFHATGSGQCHKSDAHRTSETCVLDIGQTPTVQKIEERLADLVNMKLENLERLSMVKYSPGQYFRAHHDGEYRPWTVFLYLNSLPPDDEGETHFMKLGLRFAPRAGCAVIWPNARPDGSRDERLEHQGKPPRSGVKYGVNCFFNKKPMRAAVQCVRRHPQLVRPPDLWAPILEDGGDSGFANLFSCC
mmetsp:Transcript_6159/g.13659  ORF Transcript_6159/g.13659 Transcript_6159/m.13659 type:complete len:263 (-) Transcript_6159:135-923(-)